MPGGSGDGGGTPARGGDFMPTWVLVDPDRDYRARLNVGYQITANPVTVAWHEVRQGELKLIVQGSNLAGTLTIPANEWFQAYLLPWNQGCSARMQLPVATGACRAFFTAEMNGCCFMVSGQHRQPVVTHFNVGDIRDPAAREKAWQTMMARSAKGQQTDSMAVLRKWDVAPVPQQAKGFGGLQFQSAQYQSSNTESTQAIADFERYLEHQNKKLVGGGAPILDIRVSTFGVGDAGTGNWQFVYQRNLFAKGPQVKTKLGKTGGLKKFFGRDRRQVESVEKYIRIGGSQYVVLWPAGTGRLNIPPAPNDGDIFAGLFD
jgi:hypothetical protein